MNGESWCLWYLVSRVGFCRVSDSLGDCKYIGTRTVKRIPTLPAARLLAAAPLPLRRGHVGHSGRTPWLLCGGCYSCRALAAVRNNGDSRSLKECSCKGTSFCSMGSQPIVSAPCAPELRQPDYSSDDPLLVIDGHWTWRSHT